MKLLNTAFLFFVIVCATLSAYAQTGAFSFQGRLNDGSASANGTFDMQFKLFDAVAGGTQVGVTLTNSAVDVANGVFSVTLDFGAAPFVSGGARWLEVSVRRIGDPGYVTLSPRQQILTSPFSIKTISANFLSATCVGCVSDYQIANVSGSKILGSVATADNVSGVVAVANGGTGSATKSFVDLTSAQTVGGDKTFSNNVTVNGTLAATLGQTASTVYGVATLIVPPTMSTQTVIPGLTQTITVPAGYKVLVMADGGAQSMASTATGIAAFEVFITVDGIPQTNGNYRRVAMPSTAGLNAAVATWHMSSVLTLAAGTHTIEVRAVGVNYPGSSNALVSGSNPSPHQAELTVVLIKN